MKLYRLMFLLLIFPLFAIAQTFQPVGNTQAMTPLATFTGPTLINGPTTSLVVLIGNVLYADLDPTVGQAAVDSCNATGNPPPVGSGAGLGAPNCENNRNPAMVADAQSRAKLAIGQIPASVLQQYKLRTVQ